MKKRLAVILITVLLLVVSVIPGSAKSESATVTGTCTIIGSSMEEGWGINLPPDPDFRIWWNDNGMIHWRNALWLFECDYDDDRLDGYMLVSDNWNVFANPNKENLVQTFAKAYSADENGNVLKLWEGSSVGVLDQAGNSSNKVNYHGLGVNQGLHADLTLTTPISYGVYPVTGELIDTGK